jgi:RHS repeat-associated protein
VSKSLLSTTTSFVYDGPNPVQEQQGSTVTANLLTGGLDERFQRADATGSYSYLTDALGSTEALTSATGAEQTTYSYGPYGSLSITGTNSNDYTYTGREADGLGIYYYRARYYNLNIGRFISEDPIGLRGGVNEYAYAGDSPTNFIDPFGMDRGPGGPGGSGGPGGQSGCGGGFWSLFGGGCSQSQGYNPNCAPCLNPGALDPTQSGENEPNPFLTFVADAAGVTSALLNNTPLGRVSSVVGFVHDPSVPNFILTAESNLIPVAIEGSDLPIAFAFAVYDGSQFAGNTLTQVFTPDQYQADTIPGDQSYNLPVQDVEIGLGGQPPQ